MIVLKTSCLPFRNQYTEVEKSRGLKARRALVHHRNRKANNEEYRRDMDRAVRDERCSVLNGERDNTILGGWDQELCSSSNSCGCCVHVQKDLSSARARLLSAHLVQA